MTPPNFYAHAGSLDRIGHRRKDTAWLGASLADETTRFIPLWRSQHPIVETEDGIKPLSVRLDVVRSWIDAGVAVTLLGDRDGVTLFGVELPEEVALGQIHDLNDRSVRLSELRSLGTLLSNEDAGLLAYARGMLNWQNRHRFCGVCGAKTELIEAGHVRRCTNPLCATSHFPRIDPAVIMLVTHEDRCLLGRQASWPQGMYSALAGFVEPGESLEDAVVREVLEEAGIRLRPGAISYHSSQPWPFPGNIMLGFHAAAHSTDLHIDLAELQDAQWFDRGWLLQNQQSETFRLPGQNAIARRLIDDWLIKPEKLTGQSSERPAEHQGNNFDERA